MVTDTKNKRGRPKLPNTIAAETAFNEMETRAAQNISYAGTFIHAAGYSYNSFFVTGKGRIRRQGIAEQLGRMLEGELITIEQARELAQWAIDEYNSGGSVKAIADTLRLYRQNLAATVKADGQQARP